MAVSSSGDPGSVEPEPVPVRVRLGVRMRDPFGTGTDGGREGANYRRRRKEEEGGLNPDRVSPFSFATSGLRSGSQGTLSGARGPGRDGGRGEHAAQRGGAAGVEGGHGTR